MPLNVNYMGLNLKNPVIIASSPFTMTVDKIKKLEAHGAGAVVLKSIFEEQIVGETEYLERFNDYPEASDYLRSYVGNERLNEYATLIRNLKNEVSIPIIASINCQSAGNWVEYARAIESAGADALELNIYLMPTDINESSAEVEAGYLDIVSRVTALLKIPVSVKLGMRFTNVLSIAREIYYRNAKGVVMFNRFFEPDIDVNNMQVVSSESVSMNYELRNNLRTVALCSGQIPMLDIAVSTGVHNGEDVVKSILVGAKAVEVCSALYAHGLSVIDQMNSFLEKWMDDHGFSTPEDFRGTLNYHGESYDELYQRVQYMKFFPK